MSAPSALASVGQIAIVVTDLPRAVGFYRDTLGIPFLFEAPPALAFFDCGGVRLMLTRAEPGAPAAGTSIIYYRVGDIGAAYARLMDRGVSFAEEPHVVARMADHDLWMAVCRDSEGNYVALMNELARARDQP